MTGARRRLPDVHPRPVTHGLVNELPDEIFDRVTEFAEAGSVHADGEDFAAAERSWAEALDLLPAPTTSWEAYTWLWASIGDVRYSAGDAAGCADAMRRALEADDAVMNPFVHYLLGKALIRLGDQPAGSDELMRAYLLDGEEIFGADGDEGASMRAELVAAGAELPDPPGRRRWLRRC